jgi:hypothetical protein
VQNVVPIPLARGMCRGPGGELRKRKYERRDIRSVAPRRKPINLEQCQSQLLMKC